MDWRSRSQHSSWELWLFVGTFCIHAAYAFFIVPPDPMWDEPRYLEYAKNLTHGFYTDPANPQLVNGPGYPLFLLPMVALDAPISVMRLSSALLLAAAVWFTFRMIRPYAGSVWALGVASVIALHPVSLYVVPHILSEGLALFCVAGFGWALTSLLRGNRPGVLIAVACVATLGWLVLTRVLFGYVLMAMTVVVAAVALLGGKRKKPWVSAILVLSGALAVCSPYLAYSYRVTGEVFKWSTNGGELLYWATSTNPGERGSWFDKSDVFSHPELEANHGEFYRKLETLPYLEQEVAYRARAMENFARDPMGAVRNWVANINRLIFAFPRSFRYEEAKTTALVLFQVPILAFILVSAYCMARRPRTVQPETCLLAVMCAIYAGLSSLLPAHPRYLLVIFPWIGFVIAATLAPRLRIQLSLD